MSDLSRFENYLSKILPFGTSPYDFADKEKCIQSHMMYMFNRTWTMFTYENLPETITPRVLELYLQLNGNVCFYEYEGNLYVFTGGLGGYPDVYYMPTKYVISNPALKLFVTADIDKDCIVIPNDTLWVGLTPLFRRYATMLTENELSMKLATINTRIIAPISAQDDRTRESALKYLEDIESGKQGVIGESAFLEGLKTLPYAQSHSNILTNLIEFEQYVKASFFNEIGLNANYNMKRESLNSSESQLNNDALLPLVDDMLINRQMGIEKVNRMFGTNISVKLASSWEDNEQEIELEHGETIEEETNNKGGDENDVK